MSRPSRGRPRPSVRRVAGHSAARPAPVEPSTSLPSLDVLFDELHRQDESYERRVALLNTGIAAVITVAGVTIGFRATQPSAFGVLAQLAAVVAIVFAMRAVRLREGVGLSLRELRMQLLTADEETTKLQILDTSLDLREQAEAGLRERLRRWDRAKNALLVAVALAVAGSIVDYAQDQDWWRKHEPSREDRPAVVSTPTPGSAVPSSPGAD